MVVHAFFPPWRIIFDGYQQGKRQGRHSFRSSDGGRSWTNPADREMGLLLSQGKYSCAPGAVAVNKGRIWRAMEEDLTIKTGGKHYRAFMMSAPTNADLSRLPVGQSAIPSPATPLGCRVNSAAGCEGNAVVAPDGQMVDILRAHYTIGTEKAAIVHISADGHTATFDPEHDFVEFPGGSKKFTIRFDSVSRLYWALVNPVPSMPPAAMITFATRWRSPVLPNLMKWTVRSIILHHPDAQKHAFQYADWQFDGDDMIAVVRTAADDQFGGAHSFHDAELSYVLPRLNDFGKCQREIAKGYADCRHSRIFSISGSGSQLKPWTTAGPLSQTGNISGRESRRHFVDGVTRRPAAVRIRKSASTPNMMRFFKSSPRLINPD